MRLTNRVALAALLCLLFVYRHALAADSAQACAIYPIALAAEFLDGAEPGQSFHQVPRRHASGGFGWATWSGNPNATALAASLVPPGDVWRYVNPDDPEDHWLDVGDWIQSASGVMSAAAVRAALDELLEQDIAVPVWDATRGQGANLHYRVQSFARVRLTDYHLSGQGWLSFDFLAADGCADDGAAPVAYDQFVIAVSDQPTTIVLTGAHPEDAALSFRVVEPPSHGNLSGTPPHVSYTSQPGYVGEDAFLFVASDGQRDSAPARVAIQVVPAEIECDELDSIGDGLLDLACILPFSPPDPASVAPPNDPTVATTFLDSFGFLFDGPQPVQRGVDEDTIEARRAALLRGRVLDGDGVPLAGVLVRVANHPEYGYTYSRADGGYDLVVNGGGSLNLDFQKPGYIRAHRQAQRIDWQGFRVLDDVALVAFDAQVTEVAFGPAAPAQIAQGSVSEDADGLRQATLMIPAGTGARLRLHDGSLVEMPSLRLRATEYTVGEHGPARMPAALPASSGYTYAVELSADEAVALNAESVVFDRPVALYVENFIGFPVGGIVPVGYYDYRKGAWVASNNGRVVRILGISDGSAQLDIDGSGVAADATALAQLGVDAAELAMLAGSYAEGTELWRSPIRHLTPWDCNWPYGPPEDAVSPTAKDIEISDRSDKPESECGSIIGCENASLGETIPVPGTAYRLHYQSERSEGFRAARRIVVTFQDHDIPNSTKRIDLSLSVAGRKLAWSFSRGDSRRFELEWDGLDVYGREVTGVTRGRLAANFVYPAQYYEPDEFAQAFARHSGSGRVISRDRERAEITLSATLAPRVFLGNQRIGSPGLGGWSVDVHHAYDPEEAALVSGAGMERWADALPTVGNRRVGSFDAPSGSATEGALASDVRFGIVLGVASLADDSILVSEVSNSARHVWRIGEDERLERFLGNGEHCPASALPCHFVNEPATEIGVGVPWQLIAGPPDCAFAIVSGRHIVRVCEGRADTIWHAPGQIWSLAFSPDGRMFAAVDHSHSWYLADAIYAVDPYLNPATDDAYSRSVVAGQPGRAGYSGNGGPARNAEISVSSLAIGPDGLLYLGEHHGSIRRIDWDGTILRVAGRPGEACENLGASDCMGISGDGGNVGDALLGRPFLGHQIAFLNDGALVFNDMATDSFEERIRKIDPNGIITSIAISPPGGHRACTSNNDDAEASICGGGQPALAYPFGLPPQITVSQEGGVLIADDSAGVIHELAQALPSRSFAPLLVGMESGAGAYGFDYAGRHLVTVSTATAEPIHSFEYHDSGYLSAIVDAHGDRTRIERTADGTPIAMVAPDGQRTELFLDADGNLARVRNPLGHEYHMGYAAGGMLTSFQRPGAPPSSIVYSDLGYLKTDTDPETGGWSLERTPVEGGWRVDMATAEGRMQAFEVTRTPTGERVTIKAHRDGAVSSRQVNPDGSEVGVAADGTQVEVRKRPDPRFGLVSPVQDVTVTLPSGLRSVRTATRSVELAQRVNPLSLTARTDTRTVNGRTWRTRYDAASRIYDTLTPEGRTSRVVVNAQSQPVAVQVPGLATVSYRYDPRGRLIEIAQGEGADRRVTGFGYDAHGYPDSIEDAEGRLTLFDNDVIGRTEAQILPDLREIAFRYDLRSNLVGLTPPGRDEHAFGYNTVDRMTAYAPPAVPEVPAPATTYSYNRDRQVTRIARPDGALIEPVYHPASGLLDRLQSPEGEYRYGYLPGRRVASIEAPGGVTQSFTWDGGLLSGASVAGPIAGSVGYSYDPNFWLTGLSVNGQAQTFGYDNDGLLTHVEAGGHTLNLARDPLNGLLEGSTLGLATDTWSWNAFGEPLGYEARYGSLPLFAASYSRDKLGRIITRSETVTGASGSESYGYDSAGRLETVTRSGQTASRYTFDANGNRESHRIGATSRLRGQSFPCLGDLTGSADVLVVGSYDAQDRMQSYGTCTYAYTGNGELTRRTDTASGQTTTYRYDVFGNLRQATLPDGSELAYVIDGQHRRIGKRVNGTLVQGFLYQSQLNPVAELDGSGNVIATFVYAERANLPSLMFKAGRGYRIVADHLGSVRLVIDLADGSVAQRMDYDEYGNVVEDTQPGFQPFGYAGGIYDRDLGLVRFGARDYDPISGRWTAKDPIGFAGDDSNLYAYVGSDPVNYIDSTGEFAFVPWLIGIGAGMALDWVIDNYLAPAIQDWLDETFGGDDCGPGTDAAGIIDALRKAGMLFDALRALKNPGKLKDVLSNMAQRDQVFKRYPTRKRARDAAANSPGGPWQKRGRTKGPERHGNGEPHYHDGWHDDPTKPNVHYTFPRSRY
jgi:RHS repeat-associated protein